MRKSIFKVITVFGLVAAIAPLTSGAAHAGSVRAATRANYSVQVLADHQTIQAGAQATFPFVVRRTGGFRAKIRFRTLGLPFGASARVVPLGGSVYNLVISTTPTMASGSTVSVLQGRSGSKFREALFRLTVVGQQVPLPTLPPVTQPPATIPPVTQPPVTQPPVTQPPNFSVRTELPQITARTSETVSVTVIVDRSSGYGGPVELRIAGMPNGMAASFAPNPTVLGSTLYVTPGVTTPSGSYPLAITALAGQTVRFTSVIVNVQAQTDFGIAVAPIGVGIPAGRAVAFTIDLTSVSGAPVPSVSLDVTGLPANSTARFAANPTNRRTTLTVNTRSNTPAGTYNLVIIGRSGTFVRQHTVQLFVTALAPTPGFGLSANPALFAMARNTTVATAVTVTPTGGFTGAVTFTVSNIPTGLAWTANPAPGGATVQFLAGANAVPGTYNVTITGTSGALSASISVGITVV